MTRPMEWAFKIAAIHPPVEGTWKAEFCREWMEGIAHFVGAACAEAVQAEREGNEYWGMNQELTEQIDMLREALENEWRIAHNDYCGCSLDGRMKCDHPKPKALAEAPQ